MTEVTETSTEVVDDATSVDPRAVPITEGGLWLDVAVLAQVIGYPGDPFVGRFTELFPTGVAVDVAVCVEHADQFDFFAVANILLDGDYLDRFRRTVQRSRRYAHLTWNVLRAYVDDELDRLGGSPWDRTRVETLSTNLVDLNDENHRRDAVFLAREFALLALERAGIEPTTESTTDDATDDVTPASTVD